MPLDLKHEIGNLGEFYRDAAASNDVDLFEKLNLYLQELQSELRDYLYVSTDLKALIAKLQRGDDLTPEERGLLKVWVVEDAEKYMQMEDHFKGWMDDLERLVGDVGKLADAELDFEAIGRIRAVLYSANRVLSDIMFYLRAAQRVENFNESLEEFDESRRTTLVTILKSRLAAKTRA